MVVAIVPNTVQIIDFLDLELQHQTKINRFRLCIVPNAAFRHNEQV